MTDTKKHQKFKKDNSKTATLKPEKIGVRELRLRSMY